MTREWKVEADFKWRRFGVGVHANWSDPVYTTVFAFILGGFVFRVLRWPRR